MKSIEFPITVEKINYGDESVLGKCLSHNAIGKFVAVRPCAKEYGDKTYLGLYVGSIALGITVVYNETDKELEVMRYMYNPAIFVFDLNKIIFGAESFWGEIESADDLKQITDNDIDNIWYIKALKQLQEQE